MRYTGYVADIDNNVDVLELDFETTDYYDTDAALVSEERIRLEWMQGDELWAINIDHVYENGGGDFGTGVIQITYPTREGRRNIEKKESGRVEAVIVTDEDEETFYDHVKFWLDVKWTTGLESGRLVFELVKPSDRKLAGH